MHKSNESFRKTIESLVALVPVGSVTTYGDLATMAGAPFAARAVGGLAHYGDINLPWHRVVNSKGGMARGYPGGMESHARQLRLDGIKVTKYKVDNFEELRWHGIAR